MCKLLVATVSYKNVCLHHLKKHLSTLILARSSWFAAVTSVSLRVVRVSSSVSVEDTRVIFKAPACDCRQLTKLNDWPAFMRGRGCYHGLALRAGVAVLPGPSAARAEDGVAGRAGHGGGSALCARLHAAYSLAFKHRAPGFTGVQFHSCGRIRRGETAVYHAIHLSN